MKKLIIAWMIFVLLSCSAPIETADTPVVKQDSTIVVDSTQVKNQISKEEEFGYIVVVAVIGFLMVSLIGLSHLFPPPGN